jgi:hypothetical protein
MQTPEAPFKGTSRHLSLSIVCLAASKQNDLKFSLSDNLAAITLKIKTGSGRLSVAGQLADTMALPAGIEPAFAT